MIYLGNQEISFPNFHCYLLGEILFDLPNRLSFLNNPPTKQLDSQILSILRPLKIHNLDLIIFCGYDCVPKKKIYQKSWKSIQTRQNIANRKPWNLSNLWNLFIIISGMIVRNEMKSFTYLLRFTFCQSTFFCWNVNRDVGNGWRFSCSNINGISGIL